MIPLPWGHKELDTNEWMTLSLFTFHLYAVPRYLPHFSELCHHPTSCLSLKSGHLPWALDFSYHLLHLIQTNRASVHSKTGIQMLIAELQTHYGKRKKPGIKKSHTVWFHLFEIFRKGKSIETNNRSGVAWRWGWEQGLGVRELSDVMKIP